MVKVRRSGFGFFGALFLLVLGTTSCSRKPGDAQVAAEVQNRIGADHRVQTKQVQLNANNSVVTLSGTVDSDAERSAVAEDAAQVAGVRVVINNLRVVDASQQQEKTAEQKTEVTKPSPLRSTSVQVAPRNKVAHVEPSLSKSPVPVATVATTSAAPSSSVSPLPIISVAPTGSTSSDPHAASPTPDQGGTLIASPAPPPTQASVPLPPDKVTVPNGSVLSVRLLESVDSEQNQQGDNFMASLATPVTVDGRVVIPAEAGIEGKVVDAQSAGRFAGKSSVVLELTRVAFNGKTYSLQTSHYSKQGPSRETRSAETIGGGAGVGAILGAILGGGRGAAIGAVIGAGVGTGVQARSKGSQVRLPAETVLSFRLQTPLDVVPSSTLQGPQNPDPASSQDPFPDDRPVLKRRPPAN